VKQLRTFQYHADLLTDSYSRVYYFVSVPDLNELRVGSGCET